MNVCEAAENPKSRMDSEWHPKVPWQRYSQKLTSQHSRPHPFLCWPIRGSRFAIKTLYPRGDRGSRSSSALVGKNIQLCRGCQVGVSNCWTGKWKVILEWTVEYKKQTKKSNSKK